MVLEDPLWSWWLLNPKIGPDTGRRCFCKSLRMKKGKDHVGLVLVGPDPCEVLVALESQNRTGHRQEVFLKMSEEQE